MPDNCPLAFTSSYLSWYQGRYQRETPGTKDSRALWENSDGTTSRESFNLFLCPMEHWNYSYFRKCTKSISWWWEFNLELIWRYPSEQQISKSQKGRAVQAALTFPYLKCYCKLLCNPPPLTCFCLSDLISVTLYRQWCLRCSVSVWNRSMLINIATDPDWTRFIYISWSKPITAEIRK